MRWLLAPLSVSIAACGASDGQTDPAAAPAAEAAAPQGDVSIAQEKVSALLGTGQPIAFSNPHRTASDGVTIICGTYERGGQSGRYIVVDGEDVFVEPTMAKAEMDRAFAEFCNDQRRG